MAFTAGGMTLALPIAFVGAVLGQLAGEKGRRS